MSDRLSVLNGDWIEQLRTLPDQSVHCCVTSPPYWGLRDYGVAGQLGSEKTIDEYLSKMVAGFQEIHRVLRNDGTAWVNLGDSYATGTTAQSKPSKQVDVGYWQNADKIGRSRIDGKECGLKTKDLCGIPWRVAFALQADGWYLRSDIIWHKPNPMPESVTDRPTKSHEYVFLLSKREKYYYDAEAIKEPSITSDERRPYGSLGSWDLDGRPIEQRPQGKPRNGANSMRGQGSNRESKTGPSNRDGRNMKELGVGTLRNKRTVWTVAIAPYKESHFATFPPDLIKPCIMAGCPVGGTVLDPFGGSGTTGMVALELGRNAILIELNPEYSKLIDVRTNITPGLALV